MQGIGHVHPQPAVQVMTEPNGLAGLLGAPVPGDREVGARVAAFAQPPAGRQRGQVHGPGRDVDLGDLLGDRLEGGQRAAELVPGRHVFPGQGQRPGHGAVHEGARPGHGQVLEVGEAAGAAEQGAPGDVVPLQEERRIAARGGQAGQGDVAGARSDEGYAAGDRDEDEGGIPGQGNLADRGGQDQLAGGHGGQELALELVAAPAGHGQGAGHEGGQGLQGELGGAPADLGEQGGGIENVQGQQAGLGQLLPGVGRRQHLGRQGGHYLLGFAGSEVHHRRDRHDAPFARIVRIRTRSTCRRPGRPG